MSLPLKQRYGKFIDGFSFPNLKLPDVPTIPSEFSLEEYAKIREKLWSQRSNSTDKIENIILTVSSAFLGLSVTFLKDIVQPKVPSNPGCLWWSWFAFTASIVIVLVSHFCSYHASEYELRRIEFYLVKRLDAALDYLNSWQRVTGLLNILAALSFVVGIILSVRFVRINMEKKYANAGQQHGRDVSPYGSSKSNDRPAGGRTGSHGDTLSNPTAQRTPNPTGGPNPTKQ